MKERIAKIISIVFNVYFIPPLSIILLSIKSYQQNYILSTIYRWDVVFVILFFLLPVISLFILRKSNKISDMDISIRIQRIPVEIAAVIVFVILYSITVIFQAPHLYQIFAFTNFFIMLTILCTTLYWKISMHSAMITMFITLIVLMFGLQYIILIPLIPLVYWARLTLKEHTIYQLLSGSLVSFLITYIVYTNLIK